MSNIAIIIILVLLCIGLYNEFITGRNILTVMKEESELIVEVYHRTYLYGEFRIYNCIIPDDDNANTIIQKIKEDYNIKP